MHTNEFTNQQLSNQANHVQRQLKEIAVTLEKSIDDLTIDMAYDVSEDIVLELMRGQHKLPGKIQTLQRMVDVLGYYVKLSVFPIDDNDRSCPGYEHLVSADPKDSSKQVGRLLRRVRIAVEQKRGCSIPASSLENGSRCQTFAGLIRNLESLGMKVRVYIKPKAAN